MCDRKPANKISAAPQPCSGLEIPYIVKDDEDHTATPEFVTEDGQSSLTGADLSDKLLSMSGYGKAPEAYVYGMNMFSIFCPSLCSSDSAWACLTRVT